MITILGETKAYEVIVKPVGIASQGESENALPYLLQEQLHSEIYPVHRLDQMVGGVMVYAKTASFAKELSRQIQQNVFRKKYLAVVTGKPELQATLKDYLYHDKTRNKTFVVKKLRKGVKEAILDYVVLDTNDTNSLVEVHLHTGRTHQIRVQFAARKHPLVGDGKYGSKDNRCEVSLWASGCQFLYNGVNKQYACRPEWQYPWNQFTE